MNQSRLSTIAFGAYAVLLLAFVLTAIVLYNGAETPVYQDQPPIVAAVTMNSPAAKAGIQPGDRILAVADYSVDTWQDFFISIATRLDHPVQLKLLRNGQELTETVTGRQMRGEVFQLIGSLQRMLTAAGFAVVEIDESDRAAPIAVARRR